MKLTYKKLLSGCIISSIAHAIMTNQYPNFAYEQSWDGYCFSIQDGSGGRATIAFYDKLCVGVIRNEESVLYDQKTVEQNLMVKWPEKIKDLARKDALQYVLDEYEGITQPIVSTMFWASRYRCHIARTVCRRDDLELLKPLGLSRTKAMKYWIEYYEMDARAIRLFEKLVERKGNDLSKSICLSDKQVKLLPGGKIHEECVTSLKELNIHIDEK